MRTKYYRGNRDLYKENVKQEYTFQQIQEIVKCRDDITYFAENYVYIINPYTGKELIKLYDSQKEDLNEIKNNRKVTIGRGRQSGQSITLAIEALHHILFNNDRDVGLVGYKCASARDQLQNIKRMYEDLPMWLKHGVKRWQRECIELENGSSIRTGNYEWHNWGGITYSLMLVDNFTSIPSDEWYNFDTSITPMILSSREGKIVRVP